MRTPSPFVKHSVAYLLPLDAFGHLSEWDRRRLVRLMARISEASYRRGVQQGAAGVANGDLRQDLASWRYNPSLKLSPGADTPFTTTSEWRLFCEYGDLERIGFCCPQDDGSHVPSWAGYSPRKRKAIQRRGAEPATQQAAE